MVKNASAINDLKSLPTSCRMRVHQIGDCPYPASMEKTADEQQPEDDEGHEREHQANHCGSLQRDSAAPISATGLRTRTRAGSREAGN